jgi:RNA polymerase sigma factor (sigma-70 family)
MSSIACDLNGTLTQLAGQYLSALARGTRPSARLESAWHEFYRAGNACIRGMVLAQGLRGPDVDDCIQDVWSEIVRRLPALTQGEHTSGLRGWLFVVARSKVINVHRQKALRLGPLLDYSDDLVARDADPATRVHANLRHAALLRQIARLQSEVSETNARLLQLRLIDGLTVREVACRLEISSRHVWYQQRRMLSLLRSRLAEEEARGCTAD